MYKRPELLDDDWFSLEDGQAALQVLPRILSMVHPHFDYAACSFTNPRSKAATARLVVNEELGVAFAYTVEASFYAAQANPEARRARVSALGSGCVPEF